MMMDNNARVAVIGAGTMGAGIAQVAALSGHRVTVVDANERALLNGSAGVTKALTASVTRGLMNADEAAAVASRIIWTTSIDDIVDTKLVIEAIIEDEKAKAALFAAVSDRVANDAVLASNTSSLSIDQIAASVPYPERFIGLHFFNPASLMQLVEVVPGSRTSPEVVDAAMALMRAWGKRPVLVRDVPGFIVNRVARPYYAEGFAAFEEGIAPDIIDHALTSCGGFRMGPLSLADLIGHDVNYAVAASVFDAYDGRTRFRLQPTQRALVDAGKLGRKSREGVYKVGQRPSPAFATSAPAPSSIRVSAAGGTSVKLFREAGLVCHDDPDLPFGIVEVDDVRLAMTDGRPLAVRDDVDALADVSRDFGITNTIVITARDDNAASKVAGLVQATGRSTLLLPDRPGMIVLRTLAQLANAAADAVEDDVAGVAAIDEAMTYGANHPEGPLHWAERAGFDRVALALTNIATASGDNLYLPAKWLARA
ncbi:MULTISPECIES: FAD-dependent oxidoreductase [unclassified Sphingobium]|uniref:FAD-dependent oxidoreductase n=1 Tax=unclassified Sphingobium TaxID=2611147 RepID=UPI000D170E90|nr:MULTISPECIES: FAD-dependent oxidoreductase [unclassified Sphingobium]MBG6120420.1 3-hydroxybutyryl-CoA dehydrogenase [Sphingobium sp. JAI105]PSO10018.1 3-hydroxyacyl-CoA dehydrogenase [Sphingobium sp. AEW4]TWC98912.1 3-hydroxyacyl-CoA dehydrogenase [Sphingobium sp. AEW010]TWD18391.1 3-hydroxyacyl-CoA dehydrogenase [Sphingobium sp. AEW013]TWD21019.1 3-hydroxyacyl-CoA dehydrogenase [Sphingobium sp. AEW001]